jgi:hypothetical protein
MIASLVAEKPAEKEKKAKDNSKDSLKPRLNQIEDAILEVAEKPKKKGKSIDEAVKTEKPEKKILTEKEAVLYFQEQKKIEYDFSYLASLSRIGPEIYSGAADIKRENIEPIISAKEQITSEMLSYIITVQRMDTLLGTKTGYVDQEIRERFEFLNKLSFYFNRVLALYSLRS